MDFTLPSSDFEYANQGAWKQYLGIDKNPYKIKTDKKTDLLRLGSDEKNKHWVLIAYTYDPTPVKDRLTGYIGKQTGIVTQKSLYVGWMASTLPGVVFILIKGNRYH